MKRNVVIISIISFLFVLMFPTVSNANSSWHWVTASPLINDFSQKIFKEICVVKGMDFELHEWQFRKFIYEYLGIELSISLPEAERIFWENTSPGDIMPNADKMIDYINSSNIRSAVISNIGFSGAVLTERINRLLPNNKFEFIIASSDYMFRKPNHYIF